MTRTSRKAHPATRPRTSTLDRITRMHFCRDEYDRIATLLNALNALNAAEWTPPKRPDRLLLPCLAAVDAVHRCASKCGSPDNVQTHCKFRPGPAPRRAARSQERAP